MKVSVEREEAPDIYMHWPRTRGLLHRKSLSDAIGIEAEVVFVRQQ